MRSLSPVEFGVAHATGGPTTSRKRIRFAVINKDLRPMISFRRLSELATNRKKWIWIGLVAVPGIHFYYVQEMIAALIMFSVVFVVVFVVVAAFVLIIFLLDRVSQQIIAWVEAGVAWVIHRVVAAVECVIASPAWAQTVPHRFRKEQLKENERN